MNQLIYTVTQINNQVNNYINTKYNNIWIKGNISRIKSYPSGHIYFTIKDLSSELACVFFNYANRNLLNLNENTEVVIYGDINIYTPKGQYQIIVKDFYNQGESHFWLKYQQLKEKLQKEGLFDKKNKKNISDINENIAIITSEKGSVLYDVIKILKRRAPYVNLIIKDTPIQGKIASNAITNSIKSINSMKNIDLLLLIRGGGSIEDMNCFNNENLVREIHNSKIPIITGIGHQTDITLSDFVSDMSVSTPSEAAEVCTMDIDEIKNIFFSYSDKCIHIIHSAIQYKLDNIEKMKLKIFKESPKLKMQLLNQKLDFTYSRMNLKLKNILKLYTDRFMSFNKLLGGINIEQNKKFGFFPIYKKNKRILSINDTSLKDELTLKLLDGDILSTVKRKTYNEK